MGATDFAYAKPAAAESTETSQAVTGASSDLCLVQLLWIYKSTIPAGYHLQKCCHGCADAELRRTIRQLRERFPEFNLYRYVWLGR